MFLGEYEHTIDAKGRMAVPAKFRIQIERAALESGKLGAVISKGLNCLSVYTMQRFEQKSEELAAGKTSDELREFESRFFPSANEIDELDAQGRMVIPAKLRDYAKLKTEVTVVGMRDRFEIWDRATWQAYQVRLDTEGKPTPF